MRSEEEKKEQKRKAQKKYYEKNKEYYRKQSLEESKRVRKERNLYKEIIKEIREYIENTDDFDIEIFDDNTGGCLGTDLSKGAKHILEILDKGKE